VNNPYVSERGLPDERQRSGSLAAAASHSPSGPFPPGRTLQEAAAVPGDASEAAAPLALKGHCPVTLCRQQRWQKGDPRWGAVHRGRTYLFAGPDEQRRFLADPDLYSPVLSGIDPVRLAETGDIVEGRRQHGVVYYEQIYLFDSEESLSKFWANPERYARRIRQAMEMGDLGQLLR
jgi:YHS domain-containing protein